MPRAWQMPRDEGMTQPVNLPRVSIDRVVAYDRLVREFIIPFQHRTQRILQCLHNCR